MNNSDREESLSKEEGSKDIGNEEEGSDKLSKEKDEFRIVIGEESKCSN